MLPTRTTAEAERDTMRRIDAVRQDIGNYLMRFRPGLPSATLGALVAGLPHCSQALLALMPQAIALRELGRPAAEDALRFMLRDFAQAARQFLQMFRDQVAHENRLVQIWNEAQAFAVANQLAGTAQQNAMFAREQRGFLDVMEDACFICHQYVGVPGGGYHLACARRAGWIR